MMRREEKKTETVQGCTSVQKTFVYCVGVMLNKKRGTLCVPSPSHLIWFASMQCSTPQLSPVQFQGQAGDQHRDGLAISCGHAAQYMATIGAIYGSGSNVDLKLYIFHGFSSQDKGQPGCIIPGNGAAAQATLGELASAGCKLV